MARDHITFKRRRYEVIDRIPVGRKSFLIIRKLSSQIRQRFQAFDPHAGPHGAMRVVQQLPDDEATWQRVRVLQRVSQDNPELPQILEFHRRADDIVVLQPWVEGKDLRWWIDSMRRNERQRMGTPEVIRLFRGLAHAVYHLHHHGQVVHADIKPANIILSTQSHRLVLIDFGSAWTAERTATRVRGDGRSSQYAAPEMLMQLPRLDFRADYFSLAAVCYESLTQQVPYDGLGGRAGLSEFKSQSDSLYVPPSQLSRESKTLDTRALRAIDALHAKALQLNPDDRFATGQEWLTAWQTAHDIFRLPQHQSLFDRLIIRLAGLFSRSRE